MTSRAIRKMLREENGKLKLYKLCEKYFATVDEWEKKLIDDDLLNEYELSHCQERMTSVMMKLGPIAGALESYKEFVLQDNLVVEQAKFEKLRVQDNDVAKAKARKVAESFGDIVSDFRHYFYSAQSAVVMCQSRMKRLTVTKSALGVDYTGTVPETSEE